MAREVWTITAISMRPAACILRNLTRDFGPDRERLAEAIEAGARNDRR